MTARIDMLNTPAVVGHFYLVPTIDYPWGGRRDIWPVIGPRHPRDVLAVAARGRSAARCRAACCGWRQCRHTWQEGGAMSRDGPDKYLSELRWLAPAAKTRAGEMVAAGERSASRPGAAPVTQCELDEFLHAVGRSRGLALMAVDAAMQALDAAADIAPLRAEGAMETDRARTIGERIALLARLAREASAAREALGLALPLLQRERATLVECHSTLRGRRDGTIEPIPGTLDEDVVDEVAAYDAAIAAVAAAQGEGREGDLSLREADTNNGERDESL
ncbi:hypothetical protein [Parvibaculum sp.]|uniref:hypothetical protein n=1 Tax=Parvibaculum sp. TaxID=2024848 RepID=UPI001E0D6C49|nr:hypothetical protein [Parvibaculum sp.]MBX3488887.1 hypothetical protein [Parvibaculum sp.]